MDPFMGGGTSIVEALASGRSAVGIDINSLAHFITTVKTTPLGQGDYEDIIHWANNLQAFGGSSTDREASAAHANLRNLPESTMPFFEDAVQSLKGFRYPRQRRFARCALLRLGQWAIDCKDSVPCISRLKAHLARDVEEMIQGMNAFVRTCHEHGTRKSTIIWQRKLLRRSAVGIERDNYIAWLRPKLVLTSPPYPGVHVLYHRWQVIGRRETPAPYWIAALNDGQGASYYTFGSRSRLGLVRYFQTLVATFRSIRDVIHPSALIVQLVSFSDTKTQLPAFLQAMEHAGYLEYSPFSSHDSYRLWRYVPHRRWYTALTDDQGDQVMRGRQEVLLFHQPR
jgi:hypothetical protein